MEEQLTALDEIQYLLEQMLELAQCAAGGGCTNAG